MVEDNNNWKNWNQAMLVFLPKAHLTNRLPSKAPVISAIKYDNSCLFVMCLIIRKPKVTAELK